MKIHKYDDIDLNSYQDDNEGEYDKHEDKYEDEYNKYEDEYHEDKYDEHEDEYDNHEERYDEHEDRYNDEYDDEYDDEYEDRYEENRYEYISEGEGFDNNDKDKNENNDPIVDTPIDYNQMPNINGNFGHYFENTTSALLFCWMQKYNICKLK